jgi:hypothetical protein
MYKTKTYRYLFEPSLYLFYSTDVRNLMFALNIINVYLKDSDVKDSDFEDGIFYILVKIDKNFSAKLEKLKNSRYYLGCYVVGDHRDDLCVITFKSFKGKSLKNLIKSKYSKMYSKELLNSEKDKFISFNIKTKEINYSKEYHVLSHSKEYHKDLVESLELDSKLSDVVWKNEFDGKFNDEEETLNIKKYYHGKRKAEVSIGQ